MKNRIRNIETAVMAAFAVAVLAGCGGGGASQTADIPAVGGAGTVRNLATGQGGNPFSAVNGGGLIGGTVPTSPAENGGIPADAPTMVGAEGNDASEESVDVSQFLIRAITESPDGGANSDTNSASLAEERP